MCFKTYTFSGKEKVSETGYSYFGARYYDSDLSVWLSVDPMSDDYPYQSSFCYAGWNPIMIIDPNGMWEDDITVNSEGIVTKVVETDKPNRFYDEDGTQFFLNDAKNADKDIANKEDFKKGDRLFYVVSKSDVKSAIDQAGKARTWVGTAFESYSDADFTYSFLGEIVAEDKGISISEDYIKKGIYLPEDFGYFRFEGEKTIYNLYDGGNFVWGGWMKMNSYSLTTTLKAADWNSRLTGNGHDTQEDQRAIKNGYNFYWRNYGENNE
ncbi:MAG: hypothetical protein AUJ85_05465 [Elusimicrobia bacterium CG1_02_37_114]|nr:MAG: hypothetical protein AUJ85_05465 [Elusimicrobia bacterium CG1_02_37_114]